MTSFRWSDRIRSFGPALKGIAVMVRDEHNARVHALATVVVVAAGLVLRIDRGEWVAVAIVVTLVWMAEAINSAVEALGDAVSRETHPLIGRAKDVAAGAVLLTAIGAVVVAVLIFGPRLL